MNNDPLHDLMTAPEAAAELGVHRDTTRRAAVGGAVPGARLIGPSWIATRAAWQEWHENRRPAGRPSREERERMRDHEAWEGFVGSQSPDEFMAISRQEGLRTVEEAVAAYVVGLPHMFSDWDGSQDLAEIGRLLARYIRRSLVPAHIAAELADALNDYRGDNHWEDVVMRYRGYLDQAAIEEADPSGASDTVILMDGSRVVYDEPAKTWRVG